MRMVASLDLSGKQIINVTPVLESVAANVILMILVSAGHASMKVTHQNSVDPLIPMCITMLNV